MKTKMILALSVVGLVAAFAPRAQAGSSFHFSIGLPIYAPAPAVIATQPVYAPSVVYYPRSSVYYRPVVYAPAPRVIVGYGYYPPGRSHGHRHHGHGYRGGHR